MKLRNKVLSLILPLFLLVVFLSHVLNSYFLERELRKNLGLQLNLTAGFLKQMTDDLIKDAAVDLEVLSLNESLVDLINYKKYHLKEEETLKARELRKLLTKILATRSAYLQFRLVDSKSQASVLEVRSDHLAHVSKWVSCPSVDSKISRDGLSADARAESRHSEYTTIAPPFYDPRLGDYVLRMSSDLVQNSIKVGVVTVDLSLSRLFNTVSKLNLASGAVAVITDADGRVFTSEAIPRTCPGSLPSVAHFGFFDHWVQSRALEIPHLGFNLQMVSNSEAIETIERSLNRNVLPVLLVIFLFNCFFVYLISKKISKPAEEIVRLLGGDIFSNEVGAHFFGSRLSHTSVEMERIGEALDQVFARMHHYHQDSIRLEQYRSKAIVASQFAHDIRSPLAALNMVTGDLMQIPEGERLLIRSAIYRINDIVNALEARYIDQQGYQLQRSSQEVGDLSQVPLGSVLLSGVLDSIVSEKRSLYRPRLGVVIELALNQDSYGLFARIHESNFKRVMSNLMNNAVEAIDVQGLVKVELTACQDRILVHVIDNGKGIPRRILSRLGEMGMTFNKAGGSGLGLFNAKNVVQDWGGELNIESEEGVGTRVTVNLPRAEAPNWFVSGIEVKDDLSIIVVDDDISIHQIWKQRLERLAPGLKNISLNHFSSIDSFCDFYPTYSSKESLFLIDYEFLGQAETGLDLIERLAIQTQSILVTSRFEDREILRRCEEAKIKVLPKSLASIIPWVEV